MGGSIGYARHSVLAVAVAVSLAACGGGGGGGNVRPTPPPPVTPTGPGFTPTITNDSALSQLTPATVSATPASLTFDASLGVHMSVINAGASLAAGARGTGVGIGILDSGVRRDHPQLSPRVLYNGFYLNSSTNNPNVDYVLEHGTWVALTAAGAAVGRWPGGPAPGANIISGRFLSDNPPKDDGSGQGNAFSTADAADSVGFFKEAYADLNNRGAKILNNSWGGLYFEDEAAGAAALAPGFTDFIHTRGGLVVFANGNYGRDDRYRPDPSDTSSLPTLAPQFNLEKGWLTVAALDPANPTQLLPFSQYCGRSANYCLAAPGKVTVVGASPAGSADPLTDQNSAYTVQGTSFAAPLVSGAAAVVWSAFPYFNNDLVRQTLLGTAKDIGAPGVDNVFGWGVLDVGRAAQGPGNFAWGDVTVNFDGNSVWRNAIVGAGGLIKQGSGTLILTEAGAFTGNTQVQGGTLDIRKGLAANVSVASGARLFAVGAFGRNLDNNGLVLAGGASPLSIAGNYTQGAGGNLGVWLGSTVTVGGTASLAGTLSILGVKSGYTTSSKETLLTANSVTGTFASTKAAPNVFLDATVSYDPKNVFLNINRIDVSKAVAAAGLGGVTLASAQRVEGAMSAIDGQLSNGAGAIGSGFIDGAAAFQRITAMDWADVSLRTLGGQVHAASAALTTGTAEAGRRAVSSRLADVAAMPRLSGTWTRDLASDGNMAQAGFDTLQLGSTGQMLGHDVRLSPNVVAGMALSRQQQTGVLGAFGDRTRGLQHQSQLYAGWGNADGWYGNAQLAFGGFDRQVERSVLLGAQFDRLSTRVSGDYRSLAAEVGRGMAFGGVGVTPYLGAQQLTVHNNGFREEGASGFGLRADDWTSQRTSAYAGLLGDYAWRWSGIDMKLDARAEWQRTLAARGEAFQASYTGVDQWLPLAGIGLAPQHRLLGLGVSAQGGEGLGFRFDLSRRSSALGSDTQVGLQLQRAF